MPEATLLLLDAVVRPCPRGLAEWRTVVRWRQLGRRPRRYREEAGKTHEDVAAAHIAERTKMWRIEQGKIRVKPQDVMALSLLYGLDDDTEAELMLLASATRQQSLTDPHSTSSVPDWLGSYGELEAASSAITAWHPELIHGLLQAPDYVRALIRAGDVTDERVIEERVRFRLERQGVVLQRPKPARVTAVLRAGALALVVGSKAVTCPTRTGITSARCGDQRPPH